MMAGRCLQKMVYSIDLFLVMMVVMVHDSLGGFGGSTRLPHCLEQGVPVYLDPACPLGNDS